MTVSFSLVSDESGKSLSVIYSDGTISPVPETHPKFSEIYDLLFKGTSDENKIKSLVDVVATVGARLTALSERVRIHGSTLFFDGDALDDSLSNHILRLVEQDDEGGYKPLVAFLEKVATNPSTESAKALYTWVKDRNLTITSTGDFIAYKGVQDIDGVSHSQMQGTATVNGVVHQGYIPNPDGAVVEMPRSAVNDQVNVHCSDGLHAGTWKYASGFARSRVLTVQINPRDVVMVPNDCDTQKLRVSRYTVLSTVDKPHAATTVNTVVDDEYEDAEYDENGYDADGFDYNGYDADGYDEDGYDENGRHRDDDTYDEDTYDDDVDEDEPEEVEPPRFNRPSWFGGFGSWRT